MAGIYIHIPFCKQACFYCDFHFNTNQQLKDDMVHALCHELELQKDYVGNEIIKTIYFGGGTPSLLNDEQLGQLIETIHDHYAVEDNAEITLEANPDDLILGKLSDLYASGINRLSIGVQSFDNEVLTYLNRAHKAKEAIQCIEDAYKVGISNISLDLIYAIPDRDNDLWKKDIDQALSLTPKHISSYCLTLEPDTVFGRWLEKGKLKAVTDDHAADQFDLMLKKLENHSFEQYEVSNFCLPGYESMHNSNYWKQEKYLGIGPSAHSYDQKNRQFNVSHNKKYLDSIAKGLVPYTLDRLSREDQINDYLLTTLRTKWGANLKNLKNNFSHDLLEAHVSYIEGLVKEKKAVIIGDCLVLTKDGLLLADQISADLFI